MLCTKNKLIQRGREAGGDKSPHEGMFMCLASSCREGNIRRTSSGCHDDFCLDSEWIEKLGFTGPLEDLFIAC